MFCHGTETMGFVTVCCSMSMVSKLCAASGVARFQRLLGHLVGVATCYHKVNFDPQQRSSHLVLVFTAKVDG